MTDSVLLWYFAAGFGAQLIDGAIGMAFGTLSSSSLLSFGFPPQALSATVHAAKIFTGVASSYSHWRLGNIDRELFRKLAPAAAVGALFGTLAILAMPGERLRPLLALYFTFIGGVVTVKALWPAAIDPVKRVRTRVLGAIGGFFDAFSGAGWGEIVSSGLILRGDNIQKAVGTMNLAELVVTSIVNVVFIAVQSAADWSVVLALAAGGICAAPLGAWACKHLPSRPLILFSGVVLSLLGVRTLWLAWG